MPYTRKTGSLWDRIKKGALGVAAGDVPHGPLPVSTLVPIIEDLEGLAAENAELRLRTRKLEQRLDKLEKKEGP